MRQVIVTLGFAALLVGMFTASVACLAHSWLWLFRWHDSYAAGYFLLLIPFIWETGNTLIEKYERWGQKCLSK